jgi:hypothetical protein
LERSELIINDQCHRARGGDLTSAPSNNRKGGFPTEGSLNGKFSSILNGKGLFTTIGNGSHNRAAGVRTHTAIAKIFALEETVHTIFPVDESQRFRSVHVAAVANLAVSIGWRC